MKKSEIINNLCALDQAFKKANLSAEVAGSCCISKTIHAAIKALNTPSDRCLANMALISIGCIFALVGLVSAVCGVLYVVAGNLPAAHQLAPYAAIPSVMAVLSMWAVRK